MLANPVTQWQAFCHLLLLGLHLVDLCVSVFACVCICACMSPNRLKGSQAETLGTDHCLMVDDRRQQRYRPSECTKSPVPLLAPPLPFKRKMATFASEREKEYKLH